ncbi:retrovirus-related pol polyprotein from transposon TNT 1-94 [Tanacetum coccineum]
MLTRSKVVKLTAASAGECLFADFLSKIEPKKVSEAHKHPGLEDAMQAELKQFYRNKVWTLVPLPYGKIAISSKWVFRFKKDEVGTVVRNKVSLVAQGYSQEKGIDYDKTFAPANQKQLHLIDVKRSVMYLKGTPSLGPWYPKCSGFDLKGYSDLDYASYNMERKSTLVCCANILWMKSQLSDYGIHYKMVPIFCDNTSAIDISNNLVLQSRTKHIDIRYHFIRDHILKGDIELYFSPTEYQLADIFAKPLDEPTFTRLKA